MITRRSFLLGAGGLLTTAFVTRVQRHVRETARPWLVDPGSADETLLSMTSEAGPTVTSGVTRGVAVSGEAPAGAVIDKPHGPREANVTVTRAFQTTRLAATWCSS